MEITAANASGGADGQSQESEQIEYTATKLQVRNSESVKRSQDIYLGEETGGKGRQFRARFLVPGLVKYDYGVCLLTKENADRFIEGFTGCPVVIDHKNVTDKNAKDVSVGNIFSVWFDERDGYYWCNGIITDKQAIELINQGYSVSCQYEITEYSDNITGALHNGNPYDKVIENGRPEHLAIVNNPRYEGAIIAVNAINISAVNNDKWISIKKGDEIVHLPVDNNGKIDNKQIEEFKKAEQEIKSELKDKLTKIETETPKDVNKKIDSSFTVKKETTKAVLLNKDGIDVWMPKRFFKDGKLTPKGQEIYEENKSEKEQIEKLEKNGVEFEPSWESEKAYGVDSKFEDYDGKIKNVRVFIPKSQIMENGNIPLWLFKKKIAEINEKVGYAGQKGNYGTGFKTDFYMDKIALNSADDKLYTILDGELYELKVKPTSRAINSFISQFKDTIYEALTEGIVDRLGE